MGLVVDANVCAKWFLNEDHHVHARRLASSGERLLAPDLIHAEMGSIVWKMCRRNIITLTQGERILRQFGNAPIELTPATVLAPSALTIGLALGHSFYDCLYLALARRSRARLVTADERLHKKLVGTPFAGLSLWIEDVP